MTFSSAYLSYASASSGYAIAYGVCYVLGCNYRNVTVGYLTGDTVNKVDFVYNVTFYNLPGSSNITAFPAALIAALPSTTPTTVGTLAYGMAATVNGALNTLSSSPRAPCCQARCLISTSTER